MILGNLPQLIVHANEHKIQAMRSIYDTVVGYWAQTPFRTPDASIEEFADTDFENTERVDTVDSPPEDENVDTKLFIIQFIVDQLSLEVSSFPCILSGYIKIFLKIRKILRSSRADEVSLNYKWLALKLCLREGQSILV